MDASEHRRLIESKAAAKQAAKAKEQAGTTESGPNYWNKTMNETIEKALKNSSSYDVSAVVDVGEKSRIGSNAGVYEAYIKEAPSVANEWRAKGYDVSIEEKVEREHHGGRTGWNGGGDPGWYSYQHSIEFKISSRKKK